MRIVLLMLVLIALGAFAENQYRNLVVRPATMAAFEGDTHVRSDFALLTAPPGHYPIVDVGNALTARCQSSPFGCFDPADYGNADAVIGLAPTGGGTVRVLQNCDSNDCETLREGVVIRAASPNETSEYARLLKVDDACNEHSLGIYAYLTCTNRETLDGKPYRVGYSIGEPYPKFAPFLVLDKMAAIATVELNFVTGKWWATTELSHYLSDLGGRK
jgi:hypothetical protein